MSFTPVFSRPKPSMFAAKPIDIMTLSASIDAGRAVLRRVGDGDLVAVVGDRLDLGRGEDVDAVALVLLGDLLRDVGVLVGEGAVEELDDRDLDAVVRQDEGELHADGAGADDDDRLGQVAREDLLLVRDDVAAERRRPGAGAPSSRSR